MQKLNKFKKIQVIASLLFIIIHIIAFIYKYILKYLTKKDKISEKQIKCQSQIKSFQKLILPAVSEVKNCVSFSALI